VRPSSGKLKSRVGGALRLAHGLTVTEQGSGSGGRLRLRLIYEVQVSILSMATIKGLTIMFSHSTWDSGLGIAEAISTAHRWLRMKSVLHCTGKVGTD
jgi:hypothetical protein